MKEDFEIPYGFAEGSISASEALKQQLYNPTSPKPLTYIQAMTNDHLMDNFFAALNNKLHCNYLERDRFQQEIDQISTEIRYRLNTGDRRK